MSEVPSHTKQDTGFGYSKVRGLNALLATLSVAACAPVIIGQRLRKGSVDSARGAERLLANALAQSRRMLAPGASTLV